MGKVFTSLYQTSHDCTDQRKNLKKAKHQEKLPIECGSVTSCVQFLMFL